MNFDRLGPGKELTDGDQVARDCVRRETLGNEMTFVLHDSCFIRARRLVGFAPRKELPQPSFVPIASDGFDIM